MSKFKVLKEPVSYNHQIYQPGETLDAQKDRDMEGFVQAGHVGIVKSPKRRTSRK